ncbi:hypothetical protein [Caldivirga maquilingensis]|uniref:Uncharacterized protein n=1 Tax=Caldivirga maquilingensis (strain ATCC 700844 / DSM 13496 / JCM 10307 / IC-167) TaxID=397948 RepID=A8MDK1_CALMQ|nr:hypothetical protein [Caldivirga maquilingensis]ABW01857.1 hypothetical protein Cmaq_1026 [Caldivirga maquilingensis IC-167]
MMPVILTILLLVGVYAISITILTIRHPVNNPQLMYTSLISWGINETKTLLLEAVNSSPPQEYLHGISLNSLLSIRVVNSDSLVIGNLTYCYAPVELSINNALIWLSNVTMGDYSINVRVFNTTYYNGSYLVTLSAYKGGELIGSITYDYIVPLLAVRSPQVNVLSIGNVTVLMMDAWYYLVINKPEQLVSTGNQTLYPHGSLSLWLVVIPRGSCESCCVINYTGIK